MEDFRIQDGPTQRGYSLACHLAELHILRGQSVVDHGLEHVQVGIDRRRLTILLNPVVYLDGPFWIIIQPEVAVWFHPLEEAVVFRVCELVNEAEYIVGYNTPRSNIAAMADLFVDDLGTTKDGVGGRVVGGYRRGVIGGMRDDG